jgi:hypothetical protein
MSQSKRSVSRLNYIEFDPAEGDATQPSQEHAAQLPGLLENIKRLTPKNMNLEDHSKLLPGSQNPNSISSVFSKEYQSLSGVDRVFKKSMFFMIAHLIFFVGVVLVGLNWFSLSFFFSLFIVITSLAISNVFYIIVADRSYVWISLLAQAFILIVVNSFYGEGFSQITLLLTLFTVLLFYIAYTELEKVQLSSRLFSISHITSEASRILLTAVTVVIALGVFNSIISEGFVDGENQGSKPFLDRVLLSNSFIMDNVIIGQFRNFSVNRFVMQGRFSPGSDRAILYGARSNRDAVFRDFLFQNYPGDVLTATEEGNLRISECTTAPGSTECDLVINDIVDEKLIEFKEDKYANLPYDLDTPMTTDNFDIITKQFYLNVTENFESTTDSGDSIIPSILLIFPTTSLIPAAFAVVVFLLLSLIKFLLGWLTQAVTWIVWKTLTYVGFVKIDVETVEAEIVSI